MSYSDLLRKVIAAPPPTFTPLDINGAVFWGDATQLSYNNNDPVDAWDDLSGLGTPTSTGSARPTYTENVFGSKPSLSFDGSDDFLGFPSSSLGMFRDVSGITSFFIVKPNNSVTSRFIHASTGTISFNRYAFLNLSGDSWLGIRRLNSDPNQVITGDPLGTNPTLLTNRIDYQNRFAEIRQDGVQTAQTTTLQTSGNSDDSDSNIIRIGSSSGIQFINAHYGEMIMYNRRLTDNEMNDVESYLTQKWL